MKRTRLDLYSNQPMAVEWMRILLCDAVDESRRMAKGGWPNLETADANYTYALRGLLHKAGLLEGGAS